MDIARRAERYAALGDPTRLAMVEDLVRSDRSPRELGERLGLPSNLVAHHLAVLESAGLVVRSRSEGDRRRRYVRAVPAAVAALGIAVPLPPGRVLFVCTHNSARSQLAAALWRRRFSAEAESAGTHPAGEIHPGAVAAAQRAGLTLPGPGPRHLATVAPAPDLVVTVCDRAHEELDPREDWWHWSVADPVTAATAASFDAALADIDDRIDALHRGATWN